MYTHIYTHVHRVMMVWVCIAMSWERFLKGPKNTHKHTFTYINTLVTSCLDVAHQNAPARSLRLLSLPPSLPPSLSAFILRSPFFFLACLCTMRLAAGGERMVSRSSGACVCSNRQRARRWGNDDARWSRVHVLGVAAGGDAARRRYCSTLCRPPPRVPYLRPCTHPVMLSERARERERERERER